MKTAKTAPKNYKYIENWTDAILIIFTSIYCSAHPATYHDMLKYIHTIRLSQGWKNYDKQFRLRKWQDPTSYWDLIDQELWLLYLVKPAQAVTSIKQSPVLKGHLLLILS